MSSDLFDGEDAKGNSVSLSMNVANTLFLTAMSAEVERDRGETGEEMVTVALRPNEAGLKVAQELRDALSEWIRHVKEDP